MSAQPSLNVPLSRVISLADLDQAEALFGRWQGRLEQLSTGQFTGQLRVVQRGPVRIVEVEANQRVLLRGRDAAGVVALHPVTAGNAQCLWQGRRLAPGQLVVVGSEAEVDHYSSRRTSDLGVSLCPQALRAAARSLLTADDFVTPPTWAALAPSPEPFADLQRQIDRLFRFGLAVPHLLGTPDGHRLEQECLRAIVAVLYPLPTPPGLSRTGRARLLRSAEEFLRACLGQPIGAIDLCRELGVSERTLRLAFRERYGLGPMTYFKCLRLNAVRARLKATPDLAIAEVAQAFGFHHLGNFAADFRRQFGELPSQTQRGPRSSR